MFILSIAHCSGKWEGIALKLEVNHTGWISAQNDCPMSVRNRCVIERFVACYFDYALSVV